MEGNLLKFKVPAVLRHVAPPTPPPSDVIDRGNSRLLLDTARHVIYTSKILTDFVTDNRNLARQLGIDTIIVELSGLEASGKLESIKDALEETVASGAETNLTLDGISYLKRAEKLVAEANMTISKMTGTEPSGGTPAHGASLGLPALGVGEAGSGSSFSNQLLILGMVSVVAFAVIAIVFAVSKK